MFQKLKYKVDMDKHLKKILTIIIYLVILLTNEKIMAKSFISQSGGMSLPIIIDDKYFVNIGDYGYHLKVLNYSIMSDDSSFLGLQASWQMGSTPLSSEKYHKMIYTGINIGPIFSFKFKKATANIIPMIGYSIFSLDDKQSNSTADKTNSFVYSCEAQWKFSLNDRCGITFNYDYQLAKPSFSDGKYFIALNSINIGYYINILN